MSLVSFKSPLSLCPPNSCLIATVFLFVFHIVWYSGGAYAINCTMGNENVPENSPVETPGLYIDINNPAPCSGQLTEWHYCYYEPSTRRASTYTVQLGVWRLNSQSNLYTKMGEFEITQRVERRSNNFRCASIQLQSDQYIDIAMGDYLGVIVGTPTLPMAVSFAGSRLLRATSVTDASTLSVSAAGGDFEELGNSAIHISAEIGVRCMKIGQ